MRLTDLCMRKVLVIIAAGLSTAALCLSPVGHLFANGLFSGRRFSKCSTLAFYI